MLVLLLVMKQLGLDFFSDFACDSSRGLVPWENHRSVMRAATKELREVVVSSASSLLQITPLNMLRATRKRFTSVSLSHAHTHTHSHATRAGEREKESLKDTMPSFRKAVQDEKANRRTVKNHTRATRSSFAEILDCFCGACG